MARTFELNIAERFIFSKLRNDATLVAMSSLTRIFNPVAPQGSLFPYIIFAYQGGSDTMVLNGIRVFSQVLYQVKVVDKNTSFSVADPIFARIDEVLHKSFGSVLEGYVLGAIREGQISYPEVIQDVTYLHRGGIYRLFAQDL